MPLLSVLLILCGLAIFLYPTVSNYFAERNFVRAIKTYDNKVAEMDTEAINAAWQEAKEYNEAVEFFNEYGLSMTRLCPAAVMLCRITMNRCLISTETVLWDTLKYLK